MTRLPRVCITFGFLIACASNFACIQRYGTGIDGQQSRSSRMYTHIFRDMTNAPAVNWDAEEKALRPHAKGPNPTYKALSDYSAVLLHLGRTREAIQILEPLAHRYGGEYEIVANLGTAYELDGQNENALHYISRGIEINEDSHMGSEWIHVKILEAKIALAKDPNWLQSHSVLGHNFGQGDIPVLPLSLKSDQLWRQNIPLSIRYQLHERLQFVRPPDAIVADLLFDLANFLAVTDVLESAIPVYEFALRFDPGRSILKSRVAHMNGIILRAKIFRYGLYAALVASILFGLIYAVYRRIKNGQPL